MDQQLLGDNEAPNGQLVTDIFQVSTRAALLPPALQNVIPDVSDVAIPDTLFLLGPFVPRG